MRRDDRGELTFSSGVHGVLVIVAATLALAAVGWLLAAVLVAFAGPS